MAMVEADRVRWPRFFTTSALIAWSRAARTPRLRAIAAASRVAPTASAARSCMWVTTKISHRRGRKRKVALQGAGIGHEQPQGFRVARDRPHEHGIEVGNQRGDPAQREAEVDQPRRR